MSVETKSRPSPPSEELDGYHIQYWVGYASAMITVMYRHFNSNPRVARELLVLIRPEVARLIATDVQQSLEGEDEVIQIAKQLLSEGFFDG